MAEVIRFFMGEPVRFGDLPPACWISDFPPLPGETTDEYHRRVTPELLMAHYAYKTPRKWWQFWR